MVIPLFFYLVLKEYYIMNDAMRIKDGVHNKIHDIIEPSE